SFHLVPSAEESKESSIELPLDILPDVKELPLIPNVIPEIPPIDEVAIANQEEDDYQMEVEEEDLAERNGKKNHTWEETAMQLQLPLSTSEMSHIAIPSQWLSADEYLRLFTEMENGTSLFPLYDLGVDVHQVTYHPNFIYMHPCPAIYFLRCEHLKNGRPMFGFPRIKNVSKQYTWKKQGFTTAIPKSNPCVRYITANCYLCGRGKNRNSRYAAFAGREPVLRMHAVMKIRSYQTRGNTNKYQNDNYIDEGGDSFSFARRPLRAHSHLERRKSG
ncbi:hypothetical protein WA538_005010, partial [Blastocystis sp. DL]